MPARTFSPHRVAAAYAAIGVAWILLSDTLLLRIVPQHGRYAQFGLAKGVLFVAGTALVIWLLLLRAWRRLRELETSLLYSERRFQLMVEGSDQVFFYAHDPEGRFEYLSPSVQAVLGYTPAELVGRHYLSLHGVERADAGARTGPEASPHSAAGPTTYTEVARHKDGRRVALEITESPVLRDGAAGGVQGFARDVTEERTREQQLRRAERLASLGTLVGGVAHELNNPLSAIRSFAQLMLMDERTADDRESLETMRHEAERAARIVADLRLLARQTHAPAREHAAVDLNDVVRHVLKLRRYALATQNVELRAELAADLPAVRGDRGELEQVLLNLVVNAEQALRTGPGDGRRLVVRTTRSARGALLQVSDTGPGIAPELVEHVFDPFFTTKDPGEGTGLGLALVHNIVREHAGHIRVESEPGRGATFSVELPRAAAGDGDGERAEAAGPRAPRSLHVLVVDDEPSIRSALRRFLALRGHRVDEASEGDEALQRMQHSAYDVVVTDLQMPGLGGERFLAELARRAPGLLDRLVIITGDTASEEAARISEQTAVPMLRKPFDLDEVARVVESRAA